MHMMTTADQKHKHVIHCMASVSTGMTLWIYPEKIGMKRNDFFDQLLIVYLILEMNRYE